MKKFNSNVFKMDKRIYFVFILVVSVALANALLSTIKIRNNKNSIIQITQFTNPTLENLEEFNLLVTRSRMFISNWVYLPNNNNDKTSLVELNKVNYPRLKNNLNALTKGWRSDGNVEKVEKLFIEYELVIREQEKIMKSLVRFDDYKDPMRKFLAEEQLEKEIIPSTNKIMINLRELIVFKKDEARNMQEAMIKDNEHLLVIVFSLAILVIVSVITAGVYMMKKVIFPLMRVREILLSMSAGELPEVKLETERGALAEMKTALFQLREGLQRTSSFAGEMGRGNFNANFQPLSENDVLGSALLEMRDKLKKVADEDAIRNWASEGYAHVSSALHKHTVDVKSLSDEIICGLVKYIDVQQGAIYLVNDTVIGEAVIEEVSFYSINNRQCKLSHINPNEGLIGQAVSTNSRIYLNQEPDHELNQANFLSVNTGLDLLILPLYSGGRVIGALEIKSLHPLTQATISFIEKISEPVAANIMNLKANLLTRNLLIESQLKTTELAIQKEELRQTNNELRIQSQKLQESEATLRKQSETLQVMNSELENKAFLLVEKNMAVEDAHKAIAFKAEQLERSNKYKSDFLANMSHELRTPLNSVLILARMLGENRPGNMTDKQVEHAKVIHKSGTDLLVIINDILDLSKIEAGKLQLQKEPTAIAEISNNMEQLFMEVSKDKQIHFSITMAHDLPEFINTDRVRIEQVLKNLLGNAFKFTPEGGHVTMKIEMVNEQLSFKNAKLQQSGNSICFSVCDSGIGIPENKQKLIFDAFNQADSSITRKFGGTGLGLAICTHLAALLGGEITLTSTEEQGSDFRLYVTADMKSTIDLQTGEPAKYFVNKPAETNFAPAGKILIICDNTNHCQQWQLLCAVENYDVTCRKVSESGNINFHPHIIVLDATLSDINYINTIQILKQNECTRNSEIICRSVSEFIPAEIEKRVRLHTTAALDASLITTILSVVKEKHSIIKNDLADFEIIPHDILTPVKSTFGQIGSNSLCGIKVLIADDDIRNIYSMTALFENEGAEVLCAMDGFEAINLFKSHSDISIILMDIMMPGKDGLQAMSDIRAMDANNTLPIIAVTAKAMRDDREICMNAGASDYITKPVQLDLLFNKVCRLLKSKQT